jgi:hypothetical protein
LGVLRLSVDTLGAAKIEFLNQMVYRASVTRHND